MNFLMSQQQVTAFVEWVGYGEDHFAGVSIEPMSDIMVGGKPTEVLYIVQSDDSIYLTEDGMKLDWCDQCGNHLCDQDLQREGEGFVICDNCRDQLEGEHS